MPQRTEKEQKLGENDSSFVYSWSKPARSRGREPSTKIHDIGVEANAGEENKNAYS
jgi:hypothetical protein